VKPNSAASKKLRVPHFRFALQACYSDFKERLGFFVAASVEEGGNLVAFPFRVKSPSLFLFPPSEPSGFSAESQRFLSCDWPFGRLRLSTMEFSETAFSDFPAEVGRFVLPALCPVNFFFSTSFSAPATAGPSPLRRGARVVPPGPFGVNAVLLRLVDRP